MSEDLDKPAAFSATYAGIKHFKSRSVVQFSFEVPDHKFKEAIEVLGGVPNPAKALWCAIAVLDLKAGSEVMPSNQPTSTTLESRPSPPMPPARATPSKPENKACQRLGIKCHEPPFWAFLQECGITQRFVKSEEGAALAIREHFGVQSRNEIWEDNPKYVALMARYEAWLRAPGVVPA